MQIHLKTLGCRLNEAELESWSQRFAADGHTVTRIAGDAELLVLNTCAVTAEAVRKSRQTIHRLHRENPTAKLVVSGCYASLAPEEAAAAGVDLVIENRDKDHLVEIARERLNLPAMPAAASAPGAAAIFAHGRQRAFIKVQDGCRYRCSFCIVTLARGEERSRPMAEIVAEINTLVSQGVREAALTGVHVGGYGSDCGSDLYTLIATILAETDLPRLRLASVEPWDLSDNFFELFANPRLMPHMHLPVQSGSDSVLRRMARRCKTAEFRALVARARAAVADFNLTSDVIVGFPGETDEEWQRTLDYVREIGFGHLHIFSYSSRAGTKAARLPDPVDKATKRARSQELHELAAEMKRKALASFVGREFEVLWEGDSERLADGRWRISGYTPNYLRVCAVADDGPARCNRIERVRCVTAADDGDRLIARIAD